MPSEFCCCAPALQMMSETKRWKRCCRRGRPVRSGAARHEEGCWANPRDSAIGSARGDARISEHDGHCGAFARSQIVPPAVPSHLYPTRSPNEKLGSFACRSIARRPLQRRLERRAYRELRHGGQFVVGKIKDHIRDGNPGERFDARSFLLSRLYDFISMHTDAGTDMYLSSGPRLLPLHVVLCGACAGTMEGACLLSLVVPQSLLFLAIVEDLAREGRGARFTPHGVGAASAFPPLFVSLLLGVASPVFSLGSSNRNTGDACVLKSLSPSPPWRLPSAASGG